MLDMDIVLHLLERSNPLLHIITYFTGATVLCTEQQPRWPGSSSSPAALCGAEACVASGRRLCCPSNLSANSIPGGNQPRRAGPHAEQGPEVTSPEHTQLTQWIWKPASTALGASPASLMSWTAFSVGGLLGALD